MSDKTEHDKPRGSLRPGMTFRYLTTIRPGDLSSTKKRQWWCRCVCGKELQVIGAALLSGNSGSCGCRKGFRHGHSRGAPTPEYRVWQGMVARCSNPKASNYERYGGRGITFHSPWQKFASFLADVGPRPSLDHQLDRIDNNGNYEPGNVRWTTRIEQHNNRRDNTMVEVQGERMTLAQAARSLGWPPCQRFADWAKAGRDGVKYLGRADEI